jgi:hypothetical protein
MPIPVLHSPPVPPGPPTPPTRPVEPVFGLVLLLGVERVLVTIRRKGKGRRQIFE